MDPVSISASVVALIGAAEQASYGLRKLLRLRGTPDIILALNNEVSDLQLLLNEADSLLGEASSAPTGGRVLATPKAAGFQSLPPILDRIQAKLRDLDSILRKIPANGLTFASKVLWLRAESTVMKIRNELGSLKQNLSTALGLLTSSTALRVQIELRDLRVATNHGQLGVSQAIEEQHSSLEKSLATIIKSHDSNERAVDKIEQQLLALAKQIQQYKVTPAPSHAEARWFNGLNQGREPALKITAFGALQMRFSQRRICQSWCRCACHTKGRINTPKLLKSIMGMLYIGYTGVPALSPSCDNKFCKGSSEGLLEVHYCFPPWFLAKVVSIALSVSRDYGPELCLRVANVRPDSETIFKNCYFGNIGAVRSSLIAGEASVLDVNAENGNSLLHIAMLNGQLDVARLLIQSGADPYIENHTRESPYDMAWNSILYFQGTPNSSQRKTDQLLKIYPNDDVCMGRRELTKVHKIVMGLLQINLEQEILLHPTLIDQPDADGRTPLYWAAARGNSEAVRILLEHGASPDTPDFIMQGPLRTSLNADSPDCMELLLQAGASVHQRDKWGKTCLLALMYYSHPEPFIPALLSYGAEINVSDHSGQSPLFEAVRNNRPSAVRTLLRHGADIDSAVDNNGTTALQGGVVNNANDSVSVLLNHKFDHAMRDKTGRSMLHYAALFACLPMLRLLARARVRGLDPRLRDQHGHTAAELAHQRIERQKMETEAGMTELEVADWETAFAELLLSVCVPLKAGLSRRSTGLESENSESDDTTSFHSAIDHFAELGIV